jgi:hypothetical protein
MTDIPAVPTISSKAPTGRISYEVNSRNGYHPIDLYQGKSLQRSLIIPRLSKRDAQTVADWLNQGYCSGVLDGQEPG